MEYKPIVVFCTVPDMACAQNIATNLVEERLAACCNVINNIVSVYRWQNEVKKDAELLLVIKSTAKKFAAICDKIKSIHPYDTPEIAGTEFLYSDNKYLQWIIESVR
jgi:periplasmic divalent cation tolerance protein